VAIISKVENLGDLRTELTHLKSGQLIHTDAPTDNKGKGAAFSPTDLVATSLASCMITVMSIKANQLGIDLKGTEAKVEKEMSANPRKISSIKIDINFPKNYSEKNRKILELTANTCPVINSLNPDISKEIKFYYNI
jgi:uncharacterized OsmC-like protein